MDELVYKIAQYRHFSTTDLKSAYYQIPILEKKKAYTAFQSGQNLYKFCCMPFSVINGVACFQFVLDDFIYENILMDTSVYLDNITVSGKT